LAVLPKLRMERETEQPIGGPALDLGGEVPEEGFGLRVALALFDAPDLAGLVLADEKLAGLPRDLPEPARVCEAIGFVHGREEGGGEADGDLRRRREDGVG